MIELTGTLLGGRYRVGRRIGGGGMGEVYEGVQEAIGKRVALKVIHAHLVHDPDSLERFRREALAVAALEHPHIVSVLDFQNNDKEPPFLVMELLNGQSLRTLIKEMGPLPAERVVRIGVQVLSALGAAHGGGYVHRDIKPDNVFLTASVAGDLVKLLDFGIVKALGTDESLTDTGALIGTLAYMAPEQARGERVDERADLYAVGACLYHALAGRKPFEATSTTALLSAVISDPIPSLEVLRPDVEPTVRRTIERALSKRKEDRFESASEMLEALSGARDVASVALPETVRGAPSDVETVKPFAKPTELGASSPPATSETPRAGVAGTLVSPGTRSSRRRGPVIAGFIATAGLAAAIGAFARGGFHRDAAAPVTVTTTSPPTGALSSASAPSSNAAPSVAASAAIPPSAPAATTSTLGGAPHLQATSHPAATALATGDGVPPWREMSLALTRYDGKGCLDAYQRAAAMDPESGKNAQATHGYCLMLAGECQRGTDLVRDYETRFPQPNESHAARDQRIWQSQVMYCPESQLTPAQIGSRHQRKLQVANDDHDLARQLAESNTLVALYPKLSAATDAQVMGDVRYVLQAAGKDMAKAGKCADAQQALRVGYAAYPANVFERTVKDALTGTACATP